MNNINWSILVYDILLVCYCSLAIYMFNDSNANLKIVWIILGLLLLTKQVSAHVSFYKKENRFY